MWKINPFFHKLHRVYTSLYWFKLYNLQRKMSRDIYDGIFVWLDNHFLWYLLDENSIIILNCWYPTFFLIIRLTPWHARVTNTSKCSNLHSLSFSYAARQSMSSSIMSRPWLAHSLETYVTKTFSSQNLVIMTYTYWYDECHAIVVVWPPQSMINMLPIPSNDTSSITSWREVKFPWLLQCSNKVCYGLSIGETNYFLLVQTHYYHI